jgi:Na+-transporting methylmalonyl-CoA/oxaloacetate decarboxylase gamma subunit
MNLLSEVNPSLIESSQAISMAGLAIVFCTLVFISLFVALIPRVLKLVALVYPEEVLVVKKDDKMTSLIDEREKIAAAIAVSHHLSLKNN